MSDTTPKQDKNTDDVFLLGAGTILYALIETSKKVPDALQRLTLGGGPKHSKYFVPIHLKEDLFLLIRKPNRVELGGCQCSVQFPNEMWEGISLNHAYTRILQAYKPHLNAFTGNAFLTIYFGRPDLQSHGDMFPMLVPLSALRQEKVKEYEAGLRFRRAVTTALNFHREQRRKGGSIPYISHLLAVAALVMEDGGDEDDAIAALLHDAVDNGGGYEALDEISAKFSPKIADIVLACTDTMESPKPEWQRRKEEFLGSLNLVSDSARRVIAADKLHNARCTLSDFRLMGDDVWERFTGKKEGTLWYYRTLAEILGRTGPHLLAAELARVVSEIAKLAEVPRAGLSASVDRIKAEANYQKLQDMIGLDELKQAVERDIGAVLHNQQLRRFGHEEPATPRLSLVFVGNPGTGKTKVARLLGSIYKNLGLLSKGHVHEVSRADLVGDVIGATEVKTREAIQKAKGGFLFIDEAYALQRSSRNDFGIEAIEVLLKAMSDTPEDFGVIVAGYPEQMNSFLESNPGLRSRFSGREISFPDFTLAQLMEIAEASIKRLNLQITGEALRYFERQFKDAYRNRGASFGNARYVNSVIREAKAALAERLRRAQGERRIFQIGSCKKVRASTRWVSSAAMTTWIESPAWNSSITIGELAAYLTLQAGYTVQSANNGLLDLSALALLDGDGDQDASNGDYLMAYGSLMRAWLDAEAVELEQARIAITEMLRQMTVTTAESEWLDELGGYYAVPRNFGETDGRYGPRIITEVLRPRGNNICIEDAISAAVDRYSVTVTDSPVTTITTWWRADGTTTAIGDRQAGSIQRSHYGQFDVVSGFDLMSGEPISDMMDRVRAVVEKFRDAGTRMRQLSISGGIEDSSTQPADENTFSLSISEMVDARPPIRLLADGTTLVGPVTRIRCDGSIQANGSTSAAGYAITEGAAQAGAVVDPMDVAARIDFLDSAICAVFADGAARANGLITANGDRTTALDDAGVTIRIARRLDGRHRVADGMPLATGAWLADGATQCGVGAITATAIIETFERLQS